ncbi:MAG: DNA glycosylase [Lachnospiraceae bacterium]|nr:DNA glycosylase [Lachnospiraceae bacterium]
MKNFDIQQIADSGQIFRFNKTDDSHYELIAGDKRLVLDENGEPDLSDPFWWHYFDMDTDYGKFIESVPPSDKFLSAAVRCAGGIRILNQDPWEMLISFIVSQRKSIPAIKTSIEKLCERYGSRMDGYYAFPTPDELAKADMDGLKACSLGYRAEYIYECAGRTAAGEYDPWGWQVLNDDDLREKLMSIKGVGIKVANCTMLFGYHRTGAFPVDVWIKRIEDEYYDGAFPVDRYPGYAGIIQQYMFYYGRGVAKAGSSKIDRF